MITLSQLKESMGRGKDRKESLDRQKKLLNNQLQDLDRYEAHGHLVLLLSFSSLNGVAESLQQMAKSPMYDECFHDLDLLDDDDVVLVHHEAALLEVCPSIVP